MSTLHLLGVSFHTASVAVREALSYDGAQAQAILELARESGPLEALILSTCNRTEFYVVSEDPSVDNNADVRRLMRVVQLDRPDAPIADESCCRYREAGIAAARHLVRVAAGLDSAIVGDVQILGQVKAAKRTASWAGTLGRHLERVVTDAVRAGKAVRTNTSLAFGAASLGSAIASMIFNTPNPGRVVVLGAGKVARDVARSLAKRGSSDLAIANRTFAHAQALAREVGGRALKPSQLPFELEVADVVVAATASPVPVLQADMLASAALLRPGRRLRVFDAGMPRNVEPTAAIDLVDIDGVAEAQALVVAERLRAVPEAELIVERFVSSYRVWLEAAPMEAALRDLFASIDSTSRHCKSEITVNAEADMEEVLRRSLRQLFHLHAKRLRRIARQNPDLSERLRRKRPAPTQDEAT